MTKFYIPNLLRRVFGKPTTWQSILICIFWVKCTASFVMEQCLFVTTVT